MNAVGIESKTPEQILRETAARYTVKLMRSDRKNNRTVGTEVLEVRENVTEEELTALHRLNEARSTKRVYWEARCAVRTVLDFDMAGNGFRVLYTLNGVDWIMSRSSFNGGKSMNRFEKDRVIGKIREENPDVEIRELFDFNCRIPEDLIKPGTRCI
jgi:hypothetical protein